jgi:hypothetical protein
LPDALVEQIIAKMPFPSIFRARLLSKSWNARFCSIASQEDQEKKQTATMFQKMVEESSSKWEAPCPVFISEKGECLGYRPDTATWHNMPSLSFLPERALGTQKNSQIEGVLLCTYDAYFDRSKHLQEHDLDGQIYVANILTRSWKQLPPPPDPDRARMSYFKLVVTDRSSNTYRLIRLLREVDFERKDLTDIILCQIYNSASGLWSTKKVVVPENPLRRWNFRASINPGYREGVFYMNPEATDGNPLNLWALNVEESTLEQITVQEYIYDPEDQGSDGGGIESHVVVCDADLLMINIDYFHGNVVHMDVESYKLKE